MRERYADDFKILIIYNKVSTTVARTLGRN